MKDFADKLTDLVSDEINSCEDLIDTLSDLQSNLTGALTLVIMALKAEGIDYPPERVCLDIKRVIKELPCK